MVRGDDEKSFYWDGNAAAMAEKDELHYYLQYELGSPVRVSGYDSGYLTYGYDEFGNDLYSDLEEAGIPSPYSRQGEEQPFGYTGYRYDDISGTYFAQAREYQPKNGRFTAQDVIQGNGAVPETLNRYGYCWGNPVGLVDLDGLTPEEGEYSLYYLNNMDGAKIFGHNAILLVDSEGNGEFYSFMGTGSMEEAIQGKTSLGYMGYESLPKKKVDKFLNSGDIDVTMADDSKNHDNYDRALKKDISEEEYYQIHQSAQLYIDFYKECDSIKDEARREAYLESHKDVTYNLYSHNCDHVAGEIISVIDSSFTVKPGYITIVTPNDSFFVKSSLLDNSWKEITIGDNDYMEKLCSVPDQSCARAVVLYQLEKKAKKICGIE